jgi:hypothetical protein
MSRYGWNVTESWLVREIFDLWEYRNPKNDIKKVAALMDCNLFYIQNKSITLPVWLAGTSALAIYLGKLIK